jgi:hypothetical protein
MSEDPARADAQVTFRLPKSVADGLEQLATLRGVQRSDLLRQAAERLISWGPFGPVSTTSEPITAST